MHRLARIAALAAVGLFLGGCLPQDTGGDSGCPVCPGRLPAVELELAGETVDQGTSSGVRDARRLVVRDFLAWQGLWREHVAGKAPEPPLPSADFGREKVIAFFLGEKPTAGYRVAIGSVRHLPDKLVVRVEVGSPPPGMPVLQVLTQPYHIVRLPRSDLPVEFEVTEVPPREKARPTR